MPDALACFLGVADQAYRQDLCPFTRSDGTPGRPCPGALTNWGEVIAARDAAVAEAVRLGQHDLLVPRIDAVYNALQRYAECPAGDEGTRRAGPFILAVQDLQKYRAVGRDGGPLSTFETDALRCVYRWLCVGRQPWPKGKYIPRFEVLERVPAWLIIAELHGAPYDVRAQLLALANRGLLQETTQRSGPTWNGYRLEDDSVLTRCYEHSANGTRVIVKIDDAIVYDQFHAHTGHVDAACFALTEAGLVRGAELLREHADLLRQAGEAEPETPADDDYRSVDWFMHEHGITPWRLSEKARAKLVRTKRAPKGLIDSQGRKIRKLYHVGDARKHCSPKHIKAATRDTFNETMAELRQKLLPDG